MHPTEWIEYAIFLLFLAIPLFLALRLRGKWRLALFGIVLLLVSAYGTFYLARPVLVADRVAETRQLVEAYLEETYPDETYRIETIPFRTEGFEHVNPNVIYVTFATEPNAEYNYQVDERNDVYISGFTGDVQDFRFQR